MITDRIRVLLSDIGMSEQHWHLLVPFVIHTLNNSPGSTGVPCEIAGLGKAAVVRHWPGKRVAFALPGAIRKHTKVNPAVWVDARLVCQLTTNGFLVFDGQALHYVPPARLRDIEVWASNNETQASVQITPTDDEVTDLYIMELDADDAIVFAETPPSTPPHTPVVSPSEPIGTWSGSTARFLRR